MRVSFVIPCHNSADTIHPAVESVLTQSHKDIEVVLVNDASTDSLPQYLEWLARQPFAGKVKIINLEKNVGRSEARNIGNRAATGDILCVLDGDDLSMPKRAELTVKAFEKGAVFVHGAAHMMDMVGRNLGMVPSDVFSRENSIEKLSAGIIHSTVAYSKDLAMRYPYLSGEPARLGVDDFTIFMPMAFDGVKFDYLPNPLCAYRVNEFGISAKRDNAEVIAFKKGFIDSLSKVPA